MWQSGGSTAAPTPSGGSGVGSIITPALFDQMLKYRNDARCKSKGFYMHEAFIAAAQSFNGFGTTGDINTRKRTILLLIATKYPGIKYNEIIVDNCCMQLVSKPEQFNVMVCASAGNVGNEKLVEQRKANPVALLLSSAMMLRHLQFPSFADRLETAVKNVISEGKFRTKDLGGSSTTQEVVDAVIAALD
ncbi:hypothetical protein SLEP1_g31850 [Rubroshorea leprosula]|uniref:Isopropylmalate dehydrogenase-like domain-containing protein n=1 Tax=Rubroshorea leprosula TaxID=152421 RepID=A0AAV5KBH7_9ROSI|nr:hypothetical protein SLEP1_g31850 [Rubroshorea leprosula]